MNPITWTITRTSDVAFAATSDLLLADGTFRADYHMGLVGNVLKSIERRGWIRVGGLLSLTLGPTSLAAVSALAVGESVTLKG